MGTAPSQDGLALIASTLLQLKASHTTDPSVVPTALAPSRAGAGRYEHVGPLGEGGMGRVERVRDHDLLRDVAVKHLHPELLKDPRMLAQFLWEARVTAYLDHPNIVPVHDLGLTPQGELFITMKLVRGTTLETVVAEARDIRAEAFNLTRRLRMFLQLCNAVSFAHARGVLHRDLKPANVMVGEYGEVLVTDWGLALPLPNADGEALRAHMPESASMSGGTPMYMSPEQVRGESLDVTSDTYTLGVILYELAALRVPYEAKSVADVLRRVVSGEAIPLTEVSTSLGAVVEKAMSVDPALRYPTVRSLVEDVEAVLDGQTPAAERVSLGRRVARYYVARDPAMARLRVVDIDLWVLSGTLAGAGVAWLLARSLAPAVWIGWIVLGTAFLVGLPPTVRLLRLRRRPKQSASPPP